MSAGRENLHENPPSHKARKGHGTVTQSFVGGAQTNTAPIDRMPRGPHKTWALFVRRVLSELGLGQKDHSRLGVTESWYKKAIDGRKVDGSYRGRFERTVTAKWDEYRKDRPSLKPLDWPPYVEDVFGAFVEVPENGLAQIEVPQLVLPEEPNQTDDGFPSNLAEGAWPLHQHLEKPYETVAKSIEEAIDAGNIDIAFPEFRRTLFHSGYHEQWAIRRNLTTKMLKAKLGPCDKAWVWLKAKAYMEMELRNFLAAQSAIGEAIRFYKKGESPEGYGLCLRYFGDLYAKFSDVSKAIENKLESLKFLRGTPRREAELELELLRLQYLTEPSTKKINQLTQLCDKLRDIRSWRFSLAELEKAKTMRDLGGRDDALTVAKGVELAFRTELTMERSRKLALRLIADLQEIPAPNDRLKD